MQLLCKIKINRLFTGLLLLLLLTVSFSQAVYCQKEINEESINIKFNMAVNLFDSREYEKAVKNFEDIVNYSFNDKTTISHFFLAKSYYAIGNTIQAEKYFSSFIADYPNSKYIDEVRILLAKLYYEQKDYIKSLSQVCLLIEYTNSASYSSTAKSYGSMVMQNHLTSAEVFNEIKNYSDNRVRAYLKINLAKIYIKEKNIFQAEQTINEFIKTHQKSEEFSEAVEIQKNIPEYKKTSYDLACVLGVILPLVDDTVADKQVNPPYEVLQGIKYAIDEYNSTADKKVGLLIRDSNRDKKQIQTIYNEFKENKQLSAVLGPIFSDEVRYALDVFKNSGIPVISPTATDNDLTEVSNEFFQANPNFSVRGKVMAQYIYFVENKRKIAVLSASEGYAQLEAAAFIKEFTALGGTIILNSTYTSKSFQLDAAVKAISRQVRRIEGIYLPLSDKIDAPVILSQLLKFRINVKLYGNQDWFNAKGFETSTNLSNKLILISDYFIDYNNPAYKEFALKFKEKTGLPAERNELYGYDLAKYMLDIIDGKTTDKDSVTAKILSEAKSEGYHNNISFNKNRINRFLNIVRFKDGMFELIDRFQSSNN